MKKLLGIVVLSILFSNVGHSGTYAVKIKEYGIADRTVKIKEYGIVDEIWKIKASCSSAVSYTTIKIKEYVIADMTVKVKSYGISDKDICIKNLNDLPDWVLEMLN